MSSTRTEQLKADLAQVQDAIREAVDGNRLAECTVRSRTYKYQIVGMEGLRDLERSIINKLRRSARKRQRFVKYNSGL